MVSSSLYLGVPASCRLSQRNCIADRYPSDAELRPLGFELPSNVDSARVDRSDDQTTALVKLDGPYATSAVVENRAL